MTLSVVVLASAGIGQFLVSGLDSGIARVDPFKDMKNRPRAGHGMNVLMVGTDGRDPHAVRRVGRGVDERLQEGAGTGDEDDDRAGQRLGGGCRHGARA